MLLTASQVSKEFKVPLRTVQYWARTGRLPYAQKLPGKTVAFLFDKDEVKKATRLKRVIA
jgi:DNA-binding transcriptional MerR regulator